MRVSPAQLVVNTSDAALVNDGSGGASGKYGKIVLLPYQTNMSGSLVDTAVWYDDLLVSTRRIPDPGVASPNAPDSLSLTAGASHMVTVNWRVNSQNGTPQDDAGFQIERCTGDRLCGFAMFQPNKCHMWKYYHDPVRRVHEGIGKNLSDDVLEQPPKCLDD